MLFRQFFDRDSCTYTYLLADPDSREAVLIDPVRELVERDLQAVSELGLTLRYTLETHVHADHVTGAGLLRHEVGSRSVVARGAGVDCADVLVNHRQVIRVGRVALEARWTPGHTGGCVSYVDHDHRRVFTGDTLLVRGCGRTDFQQGCARTLYASVHEQIFSLPDDYAVYPGHDYRGRTSSTVGEERQFNPRLGSDRPVDEFEQIMLGLNLSQPTKIHIAVPANQRCGLLPGESVQVTGRWATPS